MITYLQRLFHGPGRYFKCLNNKGADKQRQKNSDEDRFDILPQTAFAFYGYILIHRYNGFQIDITFLSLNFRVDCLWRHHTNEILPLASVNLDNQYNDSEQYIGKNSRNYVIGDNAGTAWQAFFQQPNGKRFHYIQQSKQRKPGSGVE